MVQQIREVMAGDPVVVSSLTPMGDVAQLMRTLVCERGAGMAVAGPVEWRTLPQPAGHALEPLNEHGTAALLGVDRAGTGLYTAEQAALAATALVSQIHTATAELVGLAEHLLVLHDASRP
ncbi:hypothetical protein [Streptomyces sp. NBC_00316]|uniref:hypothetical protein n=1 Tax=Streptomyces sp. NBC_00316 TaxID=2975710 RepID=UPI002E2805D7|nr:hypothetical protein [Streptomyces sp. NBC_00316]